MGRRIDAVTNGVRRLIERVIPWYDPEEIARLREAAQVRHAETLRFRDHSIAVRIAAEKAIARRYERADKALGR